MRIAFISDLHGNLIALQAVLADIEASNVDQIICLGDIASLGPDPSDVVSQRSDSCLH
ncbi:MAG: metallophosphoesterase family protein [Chloroflexota bacterium]